MESGVNVTFRIPIWLDRICAWPVMWYRRRKYGYDFRRIDLGEGQWTILDSQDYYMYGNFKWFLNGNRGKFYAVRSKKIGNTGTKMVSMHREIMNAPAGLLVDHRNCDSLDNRRSNLRFATQPENIRNRRKTTSKTSSRFIGVYYDKERHLWVARIEHQGEKIFLGRFRSEEEAARAYDAAARKYHGKFARLNFPELTAENAEHAEDVK